MIRAIEQRWSISEGTKKAVLERLEGIIQDGAALDRDVVNACRCLAAMEKQNQDDTLKTRAQDASLLIRLLENEGKRGAPDPEYLEWKRRRLMEDGSAPLSGYLEERRETGAAPAPQTGAASE